jgi:predicted AlkP superfamily pyrophosphatase or phosphodiesterase
MTRVFLPTLPFAVAALATAMATLASGAASAAPPKIEHVLLVSVDGLHAVDLANYLKGHPDSALAKLSKMGVTYRQAYTPVPSDSFPGLTALITGAGPKTTGIYYDDSYDRALAKPGSDCSKLGTEVNYDETTDLDSSKLDGGGALDEKQLPRDPAHGCAPVYPHQFLRVNTVFDVIKGHGGYTAWSDKHLAYDLVRGPMGTGIDDLYTPEVDSNMEDKPDGITSSIDATEKYDDLKVAAIVSEIGGMDHSGAKQTQVPVLFGMNFQAVSVAQKIEGYQDAKATPSAGLQGALEHTDASLQKMLDALQAQKLADSTAIILTAKHGQSPIDPAKRKIIDKKLVPGLVNGVAPDLLAAISADDSALIWLSDQSKTAAVVKVLKANAAQAGIVKVLSGKDLAPMFGDPMKDSRTPDIVLQSVAGVIYTKPGAAKRAEHGGFADEDRHVALIVALPGQKAAHVTARVATLQVAPTILMLLKDPAAELAGAKQEHTQPLPGL